MSCKSCKDCQVKKALCEIANVIMKYLDPRERCTWSERAGYKIEIKTTLEKLERSENEQETSTGTV